MRGQQRRLCAPSTVHMARPEVACVLHTHSIAGCAVSMQKDGLLPLNQHALQVIGDIAYHDYEGSARSPEERARFLADLGDRHIMGLRDPCQNFSCPERGGATHHVWYSLEGGPYSGTRIRGNWYRFSRFRHGESA